MRHEAHYHVLVERVLAREFGSNLHHVLAEHTHPGGAVRLLQIATGWQRRGAVEHADVVEAKEAALEQVPTRAVLAVDPPAEVERQLVELVGQPAPVACAAA